MPELSALLRNHIEYTIWATNRLLQASAQLTPEERDRDFGSADKSVRGTLAHCLRAERNWLARIEDGGSTQRAAAPSDQPWDSVTADWPNVHEGWRRWVGALSEEQTTQVLHLSDPRGNPWQLSTWEIIFHVVNHSTHHRGQVSGFLRALGQTPPTLDFVRFMRELA